MSFETPEDVAVTRENGEKENQEKQLSALLNSLEVLEAIREFSEKHREQIIGLIIEFCILFPESDVFLYLEQIKSEEECLKSHFTMSQKIAPLIIQRAMSVLHLDDAQSDESANAIVRYIIERHFTNGFVFHSFNGGFAQSIRKHGLEVSVRAWDWEELKHVMSIGREVGTPMLLGYGNINSENKISIGDSIDCIYRYGAVSPEWFAQFVCEGWHIGLEHPYDKKAFHKRNYQAARRNIDEWIKRNTSKDEALISRGKQYRNLTQHESEVIVTFFEKCWAQFAGEGSGPKLALIPRAFVHEEKTSFQNYTDFREASWGKQGTLEDCVVMLLASRQPDLQIEHNIPAKELRIVDLPRWIDVFPEE